MSKKKKIHLSEDKIARASCHPSTEKIPRATASPSLHLKPDFRSDKLDLKGPWGWSLTPEMFHEFLQKLLEAQKLTWSDLGKNGSHPIQISEIVTKAQKRYIFIILMNCFVFILIGLQLQTLTRTMTAQHMLTYSGYAALITGAMVIVRMFWVYARSGPKL